MEQNKPKSASGRKGRIGCCNTNCPKRYAVQRPCLSQYGSGQFNAAAFSRNAVYSSSMERVKFVSSLR